MPSLGPGLDAVKVVPVVTPAVVRVNVIKLDIIVKVSADKVNGVGDLDGLGKLSVGLEVPCLVRAVLLDDVSLGVLVVPEADQDDVRLVDPDLLTKLAADMTEPFDSIKAHRLQSAVAEHLGDSGAMWCALYLLGCCIGGLVSLFESNIVIYSVS